MAVNRISPWVVISLATERPATFVPGDGLWVGTRWIELNGAIWTVRQNIAGVRSWVCEGGQGGGAGLLLVVDGSRMGTYLPDGSWEAPFQTIGDATAVLQDGQTVLLCPGVYPEAVVWPDRGGTALVGFSSENTQIVAPPGQDAFTFICGAATVALTFAMRNVTLRASDAGRCLVLDGDLSATGVFLDTLSEIEGVRLLHSGAAADGAWFRRCGGVVVQRCEVTGGTTRVQNCSQWGSLSSLFDGLDLEYLDTNPRPNRAREVYELASASAVRQGCDLTLRGNPLVAVGPDCAVYGSIVGVGLTVNPPNGHALFFTFTGLCGTPVVPGSGNITLALPANTATAIALVYLNRASIFGMVNISGLPGFTPTPVYCHGTSFEFPAPGALTVGPETTWDLRQVCYYPGQVTVVGSGVWTASEGIILRGYALATVPAAFQQRGASLWITNGRKSGEGGGAGTGVPGVYSAAGPAGAGWYLMDGSGLVLV